MRADKRKSKKMKKPDRKMKKMKARDLEDRRKSIRKIVGDHRVFSSNVKFLALIDPFGYMKNPKPYTRLPSESFDGWIRFLKMNGADESTCQNFRQTARKVLVYFGNDGSKLLWIYRKDSKRQRKRIRKISPYILGVGTILVGVSFYLNMR